MKIQDFTSELVLKEESELKSEIVEKSSLKETVVGYTDNPNRRGENSNTYFRKKGTYETLFFDRPVNYYDNNSGYQGIDSTLTESDGGNTLENGKHSFYAKFYRQNDSPALFSIKKNGYSISVSTHNKFGSTASRPVPIEEKKTGKLSYSNICPATDYQTELTTNGIKTCIEVKNANSPNRFSFRLDGENLTLKQDKKNKKIQFFGQLHKAPIFEIPVPFMIDADGAYSECVSFEVIPVDENETILTLLPDNGWILSQTRAFPIRMEWNINCRTEDLTGFIFDNQEISADGKIAIKGLESTFRMNLPKKKNGMITRKVSAIFHCVKKPFFDEKTIFLTLKRKTTDEEAQLIGCCALNADQEDYAFDVTSEYAVKDNASYSLQLCEESNGELIEETDHAFAVLQISGSTPVSTFAVTETDGTADTDKEFSAVSGTIGSIGTYEIDLVSGNPHMEINDFSWEGNRLPVSIKRLFKVQNQPFSAMNIGKGWRMNLMETMTYSGLQTIDHEQKHTYTYIDENGDSMVFVQQKCESGTVCCCLYEDQEGFGYLYNAESGKLTKGDETLTFYNNHLTERRDCHNNVLTICYDTNNLISSVSDGVGRTFSFGYDGSKLISITAPNGAIVEYRYCNDNLCCELHPNGQRVSYEYDYIDNSEDEYACCPSAISVSGSNIETLKTLFAYENDKVTEISTEANGNLSSKITTLSYGVEGTQTIVTEADRDNGSGEQIVKTNVYLHKEPEKNYSYYEAGNENKIAITEDTVLPYTEPGMDIGNLRCENLLKNHNFKTSNESIDLSNWGHNLTDDRGLRAILNDPPEGMPGAIAAYLVSLYKADRARGMWQTVTLIPNQSYVFSCYLKLAFYNADPSHGVYLMVKKQDGTLIAKSRLICSRDQFKRVALPFTTCSSCTTYTVGIYIDGNVKAKAIAPQLEAGTMLSPYNYISGNDSTHTVLSSATCDNHCSVATIHPVSAKNVRETFTFSGIVQALYSNSLALSAELRADIHYTQTNEERRAGITPEPDSFSVPMYQSGQFALLQFSKHKFRTIDRIELSCWNKNTSGGLRFTDLQLVRNGFESGLTDEDFRVNESAEDSEEESSSQSTQNDSSEDIETITFEEVVDDFGNVLTDTFFQNGEFGTIYTEQKFEDTNPGDYYNDLGNNKTAEIDSRGHETKYEYDSVTSNPTKITDRCENETKYEYDSAGRNTKVEGANGGTVEYDYNAYDDLTGIRRGDCQNYEMTYDAYRNLTAVKVADSDLVSYQYRSGTNRLKSMTYANGARQDLTYDRFGNVKSELWTKNGTTEAHYRYFYDASNQLVKTVDILSRKVYNVNRVGNNVVSVEEYDTATINTDTFVPSGLSLVGTMHYSFDSDGKQFRKKYVAADGSEQKYVFEYRDEQNVAVQLPGGVVSHAKTDHLGRKVFDELQLGKGLMNRTFSYYDGVVTEKHEETNKYVSSPTTTLVKEITYANGRTLQYEYDNEERITKVTDSEDGVTQYTYDAMGQLLSEISANRSYSVTYDQYGNIKNKNGKTYTYNGENCGCCGWKDLLTAYDGQNITYDANGNPTNYLGTVVTWEKGRQLKTFGNNSYKYNNDGIRIKKTTSTEVHDYILDGTNIVKEIVTDICNCPKYINEYLYDLDGTVCGLKYNGTAYYFYKNLQGDVIAITDDKGATIARYIYDAWGKCTIASDNSGVGIATINPFRYRSYYYDTETKLYYLQSRYYNPEVGRFINADSIETAMNEKNILIVNMFAYCENNPVSEQDKNGKTLLSLIGKFLLYAFFGVVAQFASDLIEFLFQKIIKKKNPSYPISSIGDFIGSAISWGMCAFELFNRKLWAFLAPFFPLVIKYATYIITGTGISWYALLVDLLAAFVAGIISVALNKKMSDKLNKVKKKAGNRYSDYQKYLKKQQNIKVDINKKFFKASFTIVVPTGVLQLLLNLLLKS